MKIFQIIGIIVVAFALFIFLFAYILPNNDWETNRANPNLLCNYRKGWFEWPGKPDCVDITKLKQYE